MTSFTLEKWLTGIVYLGYDTNLLRNIREQTDNRNIEKCQGYGLVLSYIRTPQSIIKIESANL